MKKVGIMTFHNSYNYGAVLQAFALKTTIISLGYDCDILNYQNSNQMKTFKILNFSRFNASTVARNFQNLLYIKSIKNRNNNYRKFINEKLCPYPRESVNLQKLIDLSKKYDIIICGSDQIWNLDPRMNDADPVYFLDFANDFKKVSYAASFGDGTVNLDDKYLNAIRKFDSVSVREKSGLDYLRCNKISAQIVLDPTLLFDFEKWNCFVSDEPIIKGDYIVYYSVNSRKYSIDITKKVEKILGMKVINLVLHPKSQFSGFKYSIDNSPIDFLNIIKHAKFVCTNSFHGTVFSIIFKKPFYALFNSENGKIVKEQRKWTLLQNLGMLDHAITNETLLTKNDIEKNINFNFDLPVKKLNELRDYSIEFLKRSLQGE